MPEKHNVTLEFYITKADAKRMARLLALKQ